ncbi:hypothetical protein H6G89_05885 [Oscillatoria sp. FACHB-1407]|nr:hypothetical protein [Oscillatoria sp. FACHB-1407]MBD2460570.1 hypothetical protein [Oscillatoria sp. FACHB-1407]
MRVSKSAKVLQKFQTSAWLSVSGQWLSVNGYFLPYSSTPSPHPLT